MSIKDVIDTFYGFISYIKTHQSLVVNDSLESVLTSECNNWRLDREFSGTNNDFLILHIQDNTGKGKNDPKCTSKSASSIFTQVKIKLPPKDSTIKDDTTVKNPRVTKITSIKSTEKSRGRETISINCEPLGDDVLRSREAIETDTEGTKEILVDLTNVTDIKIQKYNLIVCPKSNSDGEKLFDTNDTIFFNTINEIEKKSNLINLILTLFMNICSKSIQ